MSRSFRELRAAAVALSAACLLAGCGGEERYHPKGDVAREALGAALDAWQHGQKKPGRIQTVTPPVQVADPDWSAGARLTSYEVVTAHEGENPRRFTVRLHFEGQSQTKETVYIVLGNDPLWVMREEEYQRNSTM